MTTDNLEKTGQASEASQELKDLQAENLSLKESGQATSSKLANLEANLNDPAFMRSLVESSKPAEDTDPQPEFEAMDPDDMTAKDVMAEMERRRKETADWQQRQTDKRFEAQENQQHASKQLQGQEAEAQHIRKFAAETEGFEGLKDEVRELYGRTLSIEECHRFAKLEKIAKEAENAPEHPRRQAMRSTQSAENDTMGKKFETVEDGAKAAFDEVLAAAGDVDL